MRGSFILPQRHPLHVLLQNRGFSGSGIGTPQQLSANTPHMALKDLLIECSVVG